MANLKKTGAAQVGGIVLALFTALAATSEAQLILGDNNTTISVNDVSGLPLMDDWVVNGTDQLHALDYYYRIGSTGPEADLRSIAPHIGTASVDSNWFTDPQDDTASMLYSAPGFVDVELKISLLGGQSGSGWSDVAHQVKISNTGSEALDFHLFQMADFDLGGDASGDSGSILSPNQVMQSDGQILLSEVVTPNASHWEVAPYAILSDSLKDNSTTVLSDFGGPFDGDVHFALQWDVVIQPGESFIVSKDMLIIPEPSSIALLGVISGVGVFIRRIFVA